MRILANLETRHKISAYQLAIIVICSIIGVQIIFSTSIIARVAHQHAWLSMLLGGIAYYIPAYMMIRLGQYFPDETFVEYLPRLITKWPAAIIILFFCCIIIFGLATGLQEFSTVIIFFMFDRTPREVVALLILTVAVYAAVQNMGVFTRILQFFFFTALPVTAVFSFASILNFQPSNLKPFWPVDFAGVTRGILYGWDSFSGYEILLLLLPLVNRGQIKIARTVGYGFALVTLMYSMSIAITLGVMSSATVENVPYPIITAIKSVELPGTFIERLENYMLLAWCPLVFMTFAVSIFVTARVGMIFFNHSDHRPFVFIIAPLAFIIATMLDQPNTLFAFDSLNTTMGIVFSFVIIPLLLATAWWRRRSNIGISSQIG